MVAEPTSRNRNVASGAPPLLDVAPDSADAVKAITEALRADTDQQLSAAATQSPASRRPAARPTAPAPPAPSAGSGGDALSDHLFGLMVVPASLFFASASRCSRHTQDVATLAQDYGTADALRAAYEAAQPHLASAPSIALSALVCASTTKHP